MFWNSKLLLNAAILLSAAAFVTLCFTPIVKSAQTTTKVKSTPTPPKKKASPTPSKTAKASATPKPKTTPKASPIPVKAPASVSQIIATAAGARVRAKDSTSSAELHRVKLGSIIKVLDKTKNDWYKIEIPSKPKNIIGWMSGQVADDWDSSKREETYVRLVEKNYKADKMSFLDASELFEFLTKTLTEVKNPKLLPDLSFKRLLALRLAMKEVPMDKSDKKPFKEFLKAHEKSVVYSEPAGEWFVRSELFWDVQKKYSNSTIAEEVAWQGAGNPLPGECEGYVNCYLFLLRETYTKYLELYPNGKYSLESLGNIQNLLEPITADLPDKKVYNGPTDVSDRAEFNRLITEIRAVVSRLPIAEPEKQKTIQQLNQIAEAYR